MRKKGKPEKGELVVCRITKIHPNSAFAELIEYNKTGMIHVSEVARRWVKNIREFLKEKQYVVCRVMNIEDDTISLSAKRVRHEEANWKLNEFKKETKAEKTLALVGGKLKKNLDQTYEEIGYELQELFGSISKVFEIAIKNPELLKTKGIPEKWSSIIIEIAKKKYAEKTYESIAILKLICYKSNGIEIIKSALSKAIKNNIDVKYISAPKYMLTIKGGNYKEIEKKLTETGEEIVREIEKNDGEGNFELKK